VYIKVASGDGAGVMLREQPSADAQPVLVDNIPDGTVLHITDEVTDGVGGVWGYTNYADVGNGYVLLAETEQTERIALLAPSAEEMKRLAEEERAAFIRQYFQLVDSDGNVIEDATPFMNNTKTEDSKSEASDGGSEEVKESVSSSSLSDKAKAVISGSEGTESLRVVSSSSTSGNDGMIPFLPFKVPIFVGIIVAAVLLLVIVGVVVLLILKKKGGKGSDADAGEGGDGGKNKKAGGKDKKAGDDKKGDKKAAAAAKKAAAAEKKKAAAAKKKEASAQKKAAAAAKKVAKKAEKDKAKADKAAAKSAAKAAKAAAKQKIKAAKDEIKAAKKGTKTAKSKAMSQSNANELKNKKK
jgi:catechol 2,3-dioxygenase-like lactoylglutathione lyase family enzyme